MKLEVYKRANDFSEFDDIIKLLKENNIPFLIEETKEAEDQLQVEYYSGFRYFLKIRPENKSFIDKLSIENFQISYNDIPKDYFLLEYSNEELMEIIVFKDEWDIEDVKIASLILKERNIDFQNLPTDKIKKLRLKKESEYQSNPKMWLIIGYISAILGGLLGILIGLSLWLSKKKLSDGSKVYDFDESSRKQGKIITFIAIIMFILWTLLWIKIRKW